MTRTCIIVADCARARFLTLETPGDLAVEGRPHLLEHRDLVNPEAKPHEPSPSSDRGAWAEASPGGASRTHGRCKECAPEKYHRYARSVLEEAASFTAAEQASRLLLVAEPRLLAVLRQQLQQEQEQFRGIEVSDLGEDLSRLPLEQILAVLAFRGAAPAARARGRARSVPAASKR